MILDVFIEHDLVGHLSHDAASNQFAFSYNEAWCARPAAFPLAPSLPLERDRGQTDESHSRAVRIFFENLLPEGQALDDAAAAYAVSKNNLAGLLAVLGQETAGALRILPPNAPRVGDRRLRPVTKAELSGRIHARRELPFSVWDRKVRLSIAGYQDKLAVFEDEAHEWHLVEGDDFASTHIIKPEPMNPKLAGLTSNELFCMRLAAAAGLTAARVRLEHVPQPVLVVERFDRQREKTRVRRLPAIDGCQALDLPVGAKYERPYGDSRDVRHIRTGASLPMFFNLLSRTARPAAERLALLRWVVFQVLIGNTDAHAKNLTFFSGAGGLSLAPAYDLVSALIYADEQIEDGYAMAIGDAFSPSELSPYEWANFALGCGLAPALVNKELTRLAQTTRKVLSSVVDQVLSEGAQADVVKPIGERVKLECERQEVLAKDLVAAAKMAG